MSRRVGQVTTAQAVAGFAVLVLAAWGLVAALDLLDPRVEARQPPPPQDALPSCEDLARAAGPADVAVRVGAAQLIECPDVYDGRLVRFRGEVVRAVLRRGDRAWVQVNDDPYALAIGPLPAHRLPIGVNSGMAVSIPREVADRIEQAGDHSHRGDVLDVVGEFRRADPADGGGPTIQARQADIVEPGTRVRTTFTPARLVIAALLLSAAGLLGWSNWRRDR